MRTAWLPKFLPDVVEHLTHLREGLRDCPCSHLLLAWGVCGCGCDCNCDVGWRCSSYVCCLCLRCLLCCLEISGSETNIEELAWKPARAAEDAYAWLALGCADSLAESAASACCESSLLHFLIEMADLVSAVHHLGVGSLLYEAELDEHLFLGALALSEGVLDVREALDEECASFLRRVSEQLIN